jgi:DNA-binding NarL/FixJ family response regulator
MIPPFRTAQTGRTAPRARSATSTGGSSSRIKAERPETEVVTMTSFVEEDKVTAALEAGASGYVLKDAEAEEVAAAVRAAYAGEVHLDPAVARLLAQRMRSRKSAKTTRSSRSPSAKRTSSACSGRG